MDTSEYPSLPKLNQLNATLANNSRRIESVVDSQANAIEKLFAAATSQDWEALADASRYLADMPVAEGSEDICREASHVVEEIGDEPAVAKSPKHLNKLLAACRRLRKAE